MSGRNWEGAVPTEQGHAFHRTVGEHRAWSDSGEWCYPNSPCEWCREHLGEEQVWLPKVDSDAYQQLVQTLAEAAVLARQAWSAPGFSQHPTAVHAQVDAILTVLRGDAQ